MYIILRDNICYRALLNRSKMRATVWHLGRHLTGGQMIPHMHSMRWFGIKRARNDGNSYRRGG